MPGNYLYFNNIKYKVFLKQWIKFQVAEAHKQISNLQKEQIRKLKLS